MLKDVKISSTKTKNRQSINKPTVHRGYSMFDVEYEIEFTESAPSKYIIMELLKES